MKKSSRWIATLSAAALAASVLITTPAASMDVQAAAKVKTTAAYATQWTTQYPTTTLLLQALSNPKTNADGIYEQLMMALKYRSIDETGILQLAAQGITIPTSVLERLCKEGWISQTLVNTLTGVQTTTTATPTYTSAAFADVFDAAYYVSANPAIAAAVQNGTLAGDTETLFQNWLLCGLPAGLSGNAAFNIATYEAQNPAVVAACGGNRVQEVLYYIQHK